MSEIQFPWRIDDRGRTAAAGEDDHIRDLIEQVLMTSPGERVNRPGFGSGLMRIPFSPLSDEVAATAQFMVQAALQQWLGVHGVVVDVVDSTLTVTVQYLIRRTRTEHVDRFVREV
jgi:phage baseplate assembly protein W